MHSTERNIELQRHVDDPAPPTEANVIQSEGCKPENVSARKRAKIRKQQLSLRQIMSTNKKEDSTKSSPSSLDLLNFMNPTNK